MNFDLNKATVFLTLSGSRAYGFHSEQSDWDYRGIAIPPLNHYIGIEPNFEQAVDSKEKHVWKHFPDGLVQPDADMQVMELSKFARLAMDCNPSVIEILFSDDESIVRQHPVLNKLRDNRNAFLSKRAKPRFCGYAVSQLQKIKRHKRWLDNAPTHKPTRTEFGLPEYTLVSQDQLGAANALIDKEAANFVVDQNFLSEDIKINFQNELERMMKTIWAALQEKPYPIGNDQTFDSTEDALRLHIARQSQFSENFIEVLVREKRYRAAAQEWTSYKTWQDTRNPARAELEKKFGYDSKFAVHLVRLVKCCREILETGKVHVKRPDAEELRAIRAGAWTYEKICEFAESEDKALTDVARNSKLPVAPDFASIQTMVYNTIMEFNKE